MCLVDPGEHTQHDIGVPQFLNNHQGLGVFEHPVYGLDCLQRQCLRGEQVLLSIDTHVELESPVRLTGEISDKRLENGRVGNSYMVAFRGQQHGGAQGQSDDVAFMPVDVD